jgi:hypothetical protein
LARVLNPRVAADVSRETLLGVDGSREARGHAEA